MRKEGIGLSIEGTDVKVAHIAFSHKGVILKRLEVAQLPEPLGVTIEEEEPESESLDAFEEAFGEASRAKAGLGDDAEDGEQEAEDEDSSSTLLGILAGYNLTRAKIAVNLPEDSVSFYTLSDTFAVKGRKLKRALIDMVSPKHDGPISPDMVEYIKAADKNLTCLVCDRTPVFLDVLKEIRPFLGRNKPHIGLIDSMDTALMGLARANHELVEGEITAIVYVGADSTRTIIMKGRDYMMLLPSIQEGANSPDLLSMLFSKMLLEQDEGGLPDINHLILAGEADMDAACEFFSEKMPEAEVEIIKYGKFVGTEMEPSKIPAPLASFALPLALARKALEPTNPDYYGTDFTPEYMKESQKPFRIAWHGLLSLFIIFAMSLLLVIKGGYNYVEMDDLKKDTFNHNRLTKLAQPLLYEIDMLNEQISLFESEMSQLASLAQDSHIWSQSMLKLCDLTERCDSLWLVNLSSSEDMGYMLRGKSRTREKITALASAYQNSYLDTVSRGMIRDYRLWDFSMRVKFPDVLQPQTYLAMVKKHSKDGFGQDAHGGLDKPGGFVAGMPSLAMSGQQMSGGEFPPMAPSFDMQGTGMISGVLRAGFNTYYDQAERIADSPKLRRLQAEQERREAERERSWIQQKKLLEEQKIAAAGKSLDEQYLGPDAESSQTAPDSGLEPAPQVQPETVVKPEGPETKTPEATPKREQTSEAAPQHPSAEGSDSATQEEEASLTAPQETDAPEHDTTTVSAPVATDGDYDRALELFKAGEYEQAAGLFNEMLAARSGPTNDCRAHYWLGHCLYGMGDFEAAIVQFKHSEGCGDKSIEDGVLFMLGNCYLRLGDEQSANEEYARLLKDYPNSRFEPIASARVRAFGQP